MNQCITLVVYIPWVRGSNDVVIEEGLTVSEPAALKNEWSADQRCAVGDATYYNTPANQTASRSLRRKRCWSRISVPAKLGRSSSSFCKGHIEILVRREKGNPFTIRADTS